MKLRMFLGQLKLELKLFLRDRQAVFWTFFFPTFLILLFGFMFGKEDAIKFAVGVVDEDQSRQSQELVATLSTIPVLKVELGDRAEMERQLRKSKKAIAIIVPEGFAETAAGRPSDIEVIYNPSQGPVHRVVVAIVQQIVDGLNWRLIDAQPPIQIVQHSVAADKREQRYIAFLLPGVIGMSVVSTCLFSIGMVVVAYREKGKLRRLSVTPLPKAIFIAGQIVNRYLIVLVQALLLIGLGAAVFDVQMVGRMADFLAALTVGMLAFIALGFLVASVANTTETASGIANTLFLPMIFLSGVYFSVDGVPKFLKPLVEFLPLTHLVRAIRSIFTEGTAFIEVLPQMGILTVWMLLCFGLSLKLFKWE